MADADERRILGRKLELAFDLFDAGEQIMRQNIRRRHPDATDAEVDEHLGRWLRTRPGAELGDAIGRPIEWPRRKA